MALPPGTGTGRTPSGPCEGERIARESCELGRSAERVTRARTGTGNEVRQAGETGTCKAGQCTGSTQVIRRAETGARDVEATAQREIEQARARAQEYRNEGQSWISSHPPSASNGVSPQDAQAFRRVAGGQEASPFRTAQGIQDEKLKSLATALAANQEGTKRLEALAASQEQLAQTTGNHGEKLDRREQRVATLSEAAPITPHRGKFDAASDAQTKTREQGNSTLAAARVPASVSSQSKSLASALTSVSGESPGTVISGTLAIGTKATEKSGEVGKGTIKGESVDAKKGDTKELAELGAVIDAANAKKSGKLNPEEELLLLAIKMGNVESGNATESEDQGTLAQAPGEEGPTSTMAASSVTDTNLLSIFQRVHRKIEERARRLGLSVK